MKRVLPAPLLSLALCAVWLLLNRSLAPGHVLLALVLGLAVPLLTRGLRPVPVRMRHPRAVLQLAWRVCIDTSLSNARVIRFLLVPRARRHASAFVRIPLDLRDPNGLAVLAIVVCLTPGTAWAELSLDRSTLLLHALEVDDPEELAAHVKQRYERLLMEIFET